MSRLHVAQQLHAQLLREIEHDIEIERLLSDARYARDVLLVCDACPGTGLAELANSFRALTPKPVVAKPVVESVPAVPHAAALAPDSWPASEPDGAALVAAALDTKRALFQRELGMTPAPGAPAHGDGPGTDWTELAERIVSAAPPLAPRKSWLARWRSK